jgi:hypothetical protein
MLLVKSYWVIPPIVDGTKSQTRRFEDPQVEPGSIHVAKRFKSDPGFARVRIKRVWREHLGVISDEDARAEAYNDRVDILRGICRAHCNRGTLGMTPRQWMKLLDDMLAGREKGPELWAIEFELVEVLWDPSAGESRPKKQSRG